MKNRIAEVQAALVLDGVFAASPDGALRFHPVGRSGVEPVFIQNVKAKLADMRTASAVPGPALPLQERRPVRDDVE